MDSEQSYFTPKSSRVDSKNLVSQVVYVLGALEILCAFIGGYIAGYEEYADFKWGVAFVWWGSGLVCGIFVIGFAEIINLLDKILHRLK